MPYTFCMAPPHRRLPPLATLIAFDAAFRHTNFTRAAEELHYSQASISRRVSELERDLGVALFERRRHDVEPTPAAIGLAAAVRIAFDELGLAADSIRRQATDSNVLTVYSDLTLATTLIAPVLGDFRRAHPDLEIRVLSSFEPITETADTFDVGIQYGRGEATSLRVQPIADDAVFPVCSPGLASELPAPVGPEDLRALPLLHVDYGEPAWTDWHAFLRHVGAGDTPTNEGVTFTSYLVCLEVAERGEGVALGWQRTIQPRIDAGTLVRLPGLTMARPDAICAYEPVGPTRAHAHALVDMLKQRLQRSDPVVPLA